MEMGNGAAKGIEGAAVGMCSCVTSISFHFLMSQQPDWILRKASWAVFTNANVPLILTLYMLPRLRAMP